jgi:peptidoglycan L-alanyl-D-glutamate endopeptidase CwlK
MFKFSKRSLNNLVGVHPDLVKVIKRALEITDIDFAVTDGLRTASEAAANRAKGTSYRKRSKHQDGLAVDLTPYANGKLVAGNPEDWPYFNQLSKWMFQAAEELGIKIEWGGNWKYVIVDGKRKPFKDGYHYQLPDGYPLA